jgi:prepilin-type N-terminal cleavage/methylation domain-containing protein
MNLRNKNKTNAFTLAEVLITLLIIGVVASLVIPGIINDAQDAELKTAWKKAYSSINQAFGKILIDNGGTLVGAATGSYQFRGLFKNEMNSLYICDTTTSCKTYPVKRLNDTASPYELDYNLVLNDGTIIKFILDSPSCNAPYNYVYTTGGECGWMIVDVNGSKGPNQHGKDIYGIWVMKNQILPWGANPIGTANSGYVESTCTPSGSGYGCGAKYLYN